MLACLQFLCVNCSSAIRIKQVKGFTYFLFLFLCQFWFWTSLFPLRRCRIGNRWFLVVLNRLQKHQQSIKCIFNTHHLFCVLQYIVHKDWFLAWLHHRYTGRAEGLWLVCRHGPVIVQCTDCVVFSWFWHSIKCDHFYQKARQSPFVAYVWLWYVCELTDNKSW